MGCPCYAWREVGRLPNWDSHGHDKIFFMIPENLAERRSGGGETDPSSLRFAETNGRRDGETVLNDLRRWLGILWYPRREPCRLYRAEQYKLRVSFCHCEVWPTGLPYGRLAIQQGVRCSSRVLDRRASLRLARDDRMEQDLTEIDLALPFRPTVINQVISTLNNNTANGDANRNAHLSVP